MSSIKRTIEETFAKMKNLLSEVGETPAPKRDAIRAKGNIAPPEAVERARQSAQGYADRLSAADRQKANEIIKSTLTRGYAGAKDATFIDDLDMRWVNNKRVSLDTPKTIAYDYMIQMLAMAYIMPAGQEITIDDKSYPVTPGMKQNAYEGLLKMFNLEDTKKRWAWFMFGSNIPGISMVPSAYRPKISTKPDGTLDFADVDDKVSTLNDWLKAGRLTYFLTKAGFYEKGFAYVLESIRRKYLELKRDEGRVKSVSQNNPNYYAKPDINDPRMLGYKKDLGGKIDPTTDLRHLGTKDRGEDPGHNSLKHFVDALKVDIDGNTDLDASSGEIGAMAKFVAEGLLKFVMEYYAEDPKFIDLYKAKMSRVPKSLNDITAPEYAEMYPHANAWFLGKPRNYPQIYFANAYKKAIKPEAENLEAKFIKDAGLDMEPTGARDSWQEKERSTSGEKPTYSDYASPQGMVKRINKITGKPETFDDYGDYYASLEEANSSDKKSQKLADAMSAALDRFFLS